MHSSPNTPPSPSTKKILLIEDDQEISESLKELLEFEGYIVYCAYNGQEALDLLRKSIRPELILLDLMMPVKNGFEFRKEQKQDPELSEIPVVVMSADGQAEKKLKETEAQYYLKKPFDLQTFLNTVKIYLS